MGHRVGILHVRPVRVSQHRLGPVVAVSRLMVDIDYKSQ